VFGAAPYLQEMYPELTREEAREIFNQMDGKT